MSMLNEDYIKFNDNYLILYRFNFFDPLILNIKFYKVLIPGSSQQCNILVSSEVLTT